MTASRGSESDDRRLQRRLPIRITVSYEHMADFLTDYTANMSIGGMFIETGDPLAVGTRFHLRFSVPRSEFPIATVAEVRWVQVQKPGSRQIPGMGVRFDSLSDADRARVHELLCNWP